jgi:ribose/xylose/arabinose/galactoside ABC-type transport system permease subunit
MGGIRQKLVRGLGLPLIILAVTFAILLVAANHAGRSITWANGTDIATTFAELGPVTLAIGLSMVVGEFDLSVPAMYVLGGIVAAKYGAASPALGLLAALGIGLGLGLLQGAIIAWLRLSSVVVTLGGFLLFSGIAYLLTHGLSVTYNNYSIGEQLTNPILRVFSIQSLSAIGAFVVLGALLRFTRIGPYVRSIGGDRRAARVAGVPTRPVLASIFGVSGVLASLSGALLAYNLAYAVPTVNLSPLVFGVTACVFGGVALTGGRGTVLGIAIGVIALALVQEALVIAGASDATTNLVTGGLLACVALFTAPDFRLPSLEHLRGERALVRRENADA